MEHWNKICTTKIISQINVFCRLATINPEFCNKISRLKNKDVINIIKWNKIVISWSLINHLSLYGTFYNLLFKSYMGRPPPLKFITIQNQARITWSNDFEWFIYYKSYYKIWFWKFIRLNLLILCKRKMDLKVETWEYEWVSCESGNHFLKKFLFLITHLLKW